MKKMFAAVTSFFRRLRVAWKISREPNALEAIQHFKTVEADARELSRFLISLDGMRDVTRALLPSECFSPQTPRSDMKGQVLLTIKPKRLMSPYEADEVLSESRVSFTLPKDADARLVEHNEKFRNKIQTRII